MSNHTRGPWKIAVRQNDGGRTVVNAAGLVVAFVPVMQGGAAASVDEAIANARLIAKTPQMHMLLRQALTQFMADILEDEPINGADAVDWLVGFVQRAHEVIDG